MTLWRWLRTTGRLHTTSGVAAAAKHLPDSSEYQCGEGRKRRT
jgi:hypothetical protein